MTTTTEFDTVPIRLSPAHIDAVNRPRRIVLQEDANMPFQAFGLDFDKWMELRFKHVDDPDSQIDGFWWDIGLAEDTYAIYDSKLLPKIQLQGLDDWFRQGIDWVGEIVAECHRRGLEAFWNNRVCPVDFAQPLKWSEPTPPHAHPSRANPLKLAHPDWVVPCWWPHGLWNLATPAVRQRKVDVLRELLERYPLDGIQLDFARHTPCLPPGHEWEHRDHATAFVRMVRLMMLELEERLGRPILLAARVGETIEGNRLEGFDVARWADEGLVDIFTLGGRTTTIDFDAFKRLAAGKGIKLCASFDGHHVTDGYHFPSMAYYRGVFRNFWQQGADCVALFNWSCAEPEAYDRAGLPGMMKCPTQTDAVHEVGRLDAMAGKDRMYAVERSGGYPYAGNYLYRNDVRPLPANLPEVDVPLYVFDDLAADAGIARVVVRVVLWNAGGDAAVTVTLNGHALTETRRDAAWQDAQIYGDKPQPNSGPRGAAPKDQRLLLLEFAADRSAFVVGANALRVSGSAPAAKVEKLEAHVSYGRLESSL